jgi:hypothetical protein
MTPKKVLLLALWALVPSAIAQPPTATPPTPKVELPALVSPRDFSFGFFPNGWHNKPSETSPDLLGIETGYFGFVLDVDDIAHPRFGLLDDDRDYASALNDGLKRFENLPPAELTIEVKKGGKIYRAKTCRAGVRSSGDRMEAVRLWESARFVQHYDLQFVSFTDEEGQPLDALGTLDILAWPGSLTFTASLTPTPIFNEGPVAGVVGAGWCLKKKPITLPTANLPDPAKFSTECWFKISETSTHPNGWFLILGRNGHINNEGFCGITLSGDRIGAILNIGGGKENRHWPSAKSSFTKNVWHHIAMTYDGENLALYLDGKSEASETIHRERIPGRADMLLGFEANTQPFEIDRIYDQIRLWDRVLTPEEIAAHAANPATMPSKDGLFFEENFDSNPFQASPQGWNNAEVSIKLKGAERDWSANQVFPGDWKEGEKKSVTVNCNGRENHPPLKDVSVRLLNKDLPVTFEPGVNAFVTRADQRIKRDWNKSMEMRDYDEFLVEVDNTGSESGTVPFLLFFNNPFSAAGCLPILCHPDGTPTGIPVQTSKNWHHGCYLCAYMLLPAPAGKSTFLVRISYGFYGTVPQASHTQLSLVGWGGNGRWDQIAIGGWGETHCLDMDYSQADCIVTDNRGMLIRNGKDGPKWGWCESGWGGDWLNVKNPAGEKLFFSDLKTAYTTHGPCLSEVEYRGHFGAGDEVEIQSIVHSPRTDDYVRTLLEQSYTFKANLPTKDAWFFKMGKTHNFISPRVAYGNRDGLIAELEAPVGAKPGDIMVDHLELQGEGPWWVAYPDAQPQLPPGRENFGVGSRAFIIRSFKGTFGGKEFKNPSITLQVHNVRSEGKLDIDALVVPPKGLADFQPGDRLEMKTEWLCVPRNADDYQGPNEALRQHLTESPRSWKTIHREAVGNALEVVASGGTLLANYPIIVRAEEPLSTAESLLKKLKSYSGVFGNMEVPDFLKSQAPPEVMLQIRGGIGYVPVRFEGLKSIEGYKLYEKNGEKLVPLDQSVHGNDFWQTDYVSASQTYSLTYNLPLDGKSSSTWVLKKAP